MDRFDAEYGPGSYDRARGMSANHADYLVDCDRNGDNTPGEPETIAERHAKYRFWVGESDKTVFDVGCPKCFAPTGLRCVNTGEAYNGSDLPRENAHWARRRFHLGVDIFGRPSA